METANTAETQGSPIQNVEKKPNTLMGVLSYVGPLVIIPFLTAKEDPFVKFHIKQGLVLVCIEVVLWVVSSMFYFLWPIWQIINLALLVMSIIGIINVTQGKEKNLPIVGDWAKHFNF